MGLLSSDKRYLIRLPYCKLNRDNAVDKNCLKIGRRSRSGNRIGHQYGRQALTSSYDDEVAHRVRTPGRVAYRLRPDEQKHQRTEPEDDGRKRPLTENGEERIRSVRTIGTRPVVASF